MKVLRLNLTAIIKFAQVNSLRLSRTANFFWETSCIATLRFTDVHCGLTTLIASACPMRTTAGAPIFFLVIKAGALIFREGVV